jgi:hypothetical protein
MARPQSAAARAAAPDIASALKEIDRALLARLPERIAPDSAKPLIAAQEQLLAERLDALGAAIDTIAHAVFLDSSASPAHRARAKDWLAQNPREAKRARFVFDRFEGLARLKRLKEGLEPGAQPKTDSQETAPQPAAGAASSSLQIPQAALQLLFIQPSIHGDFPAHIVEQVARLRRARPYIFLAFPPKCGGTFIRDVLGRACGAGLSRPGHALGGRDVTPYLPTLAIQLLSPTGPACLMTHAHMIGHYANVQLLNLFGIKPVVMKRSIPDMLCSFSDMVEQEATDNSGGYNWSLLCGVPTDPGFLRLSKEARRDVLVFHQAPWYIQFYASWLRAARDRRIAVHWTSFEAFRADPVATIGGILDFYGLSQLSASVPRLVAEAEASKARLRFNRGVCGRGSAFLAPEHLAHLHRLAAGYPDIDFVAEGLLPAAQA